MHNSLLLELK